MRLGWLLLLLLFVSSLAAELGAVECVLRGAGQGALAWHIASSVLAAVVAGAAISCSARSRRLLAGFAFVVAASLPGAGVLGLTVILTQLSRTRQLHPLAVFQISRPDWSDSSLAASAHAARVLAPARSTGQRVQVLLSQRSMSSDAAVPGLRAGLRDPREEVRLLAHALLDRRETRLRVAIAALEAELQTGLVEPGRRWELLRRLAYSHWALVEGELTHGELARDALGRSSRFAEEALTLHLDGELCLLLARAHLRQADGLNAWRWLQHAERAGIARDARAPLYAEAAFLLRHFEEVPRWLRRVERRLWRPKLRRVAAFWLRTERNSSNRRPRHS
jgi:hypothetical protein